MKRPARLFSPLMIVATLALAAAATATPDLPTDVQTLSSKAFAGRGTGSAEIEKAIAYIEGRFREAGLRPAGTDGYRQTFEKDGRTMVNLIGVLGEGDGRHAVVGAHYDHLGKGEKGDANYGKIHPGADDNASGVAALLECARQLHEAGDLSRPVVFVAFAGEESGLLGSAHYVTAPALPLAECTGMVNLDTVGRLGDGELTIFGSTTAQQLPHVLRGVNYAFGFKLTMPEKDPGGSDQMSFVRRGVPAVQIFTGAHPDYHRPGDTADKVDFEGLAKIAEFTVELARYLADRDEPMSFLPPGAEASASEVPAKRQTSRRVSFGSIPDFNHSGDGVLLSGVIPGSPAEKAGLKEGDLIVEFAGIVIGDLKSFSDVLKGLSPGDEADVTYLRDGERKTATVKVVARK